MIRFSHGANSWQLFLSLSETWTDIPVELARNYADLGVKILI